MPDAQSQSAVLDVTEATFEREVLQAKTPVVVDFWAPWCVYCKKLAPVYAAAAPQWVGKIKFAKVNVEEERGLAERFGIMSLPTLKWFCGGREIGETVGFLPADKLERDLKTMEGEAEQCLRESSDVRSH